MAHDRLGWFYFANRKKRHYRNGTYQTTTQEPMTVPEVPYIRVHMWLMRNRDQP